jgi:hypothetical protein
MQVQIINWNISFNSKVDSIIEFLKEQILDGLPSIINLQEVRTHSYVELVKSFGENAVAYSLKLREPGKFEGMNRGLGTATIMVNCSLKEFSLVNLSLMPERTLFTRIQVGDCIIGVLNFHSLTGKSYKNAKASNFASIASFIHDQESKIDFMCFDANEPFRDYQDWSKVEYYDNGDKGKNASLILGQNRVHGLHDALRSHHENKKIIIEDEPLMKSHKTKRFDYIFHSPKWHVDSIDYPMAESLKATSDHSLVNGIFKNI